MQVTKMWVPSFLFCRLSRNMIVFETPFAIHLSRSTPNSFDVHGIGGGLLYSFPSNFLLFSPVDTIMACGVDLRSLGLSKLGLTN